MLFTTLERHLILRLLATFLPVALGLCALFLVAGSFQLLRAEQLSLAQLALALPWLVPFLLPYLLPLAYLIAVTLVLGRVVADQEALAYTSLGIGRTSLAWPAVLLSLPLSAASLWLTATVVPHCYQRRQDAERAVLLQFMALGEGEHLSRVFPKQGLDIYARRFGPDGLEGVIIHAGVGGRAAPGARQRHAQIVAARGRCVTEDDGRRMTIRLDDVTLTVSELTPDAPSAPAAPAAAAPPVAPPVRAHLERLALGIGLGGRRRIKPADFPTAALAEEVGRAAARTRLALALGGVAASRQGHDERGGEAHVELCMRAAVSAAPTLLALVAAALTFVLAARSPLVPFGAGILAACGLFFAPLLLGRSLGEARGDGTWVFLALATSLLGAGALALLARRR